MFDRSLVDTINDKLFYFERESVKPLLWTKILFESDVKNDEVYSILNNLIDPRMIFLDKELSYDEIKNCIIIFELKLNIIVNLNIVLQSLKHYI